MHRRLIIPGRLPGLNEYIRSERGNRYAAAKLKRETEELIAWSIKRCLGGVIFTRPVRMRYHWYEPNTRRDKDNIAFGRKFIQDALAKAGVLKGDGWKEIDGFSDRFDVDANSPRVEVIISDEWEKVSGPDDAKRE